jgi:SAM-dependent methyltransferase
VTEDAWWARHAREVDEVLGGGDPASIKRLYVNLGSFLEDDYGADVEGVPLLSLPETAPVVLRLLRGVQGALLDAGCGPNPAVAIALALEPGRRVVALDIGAGMVRLAVARAARAGVDLLGVVGDVEALPFRAGAFIGGVCDDTIEHLPDDDRGARELARVLASGGRMVVATPNRHSLGVIRRKLADRLRGRHRPPSAYYAAESHLREYTWRGLEGVLQPHLVVRDRASVGWSGGWSRRLATRLVSVPGPRWFSRMLVFVVESRRAGATTDAGRAQGAGISVAPS